MELRRILTNRNTLLVLTAIVVVTAFLIRLTPYFKYAHYGIWLQYDDSMFEYWLSKTLYSKGVTYWYQLTPQHTRWLWWWPEGRDIRRNEYPGLSMTGALFYPLVKSLGLRLVDWVGIIPAFYGFLATLVASALGYMLFGPLGSLVFAISVGFQHAFMNRSIASFVEKMSPSLTFVILALLAFTWFLKKDKAEIRDAVLAGVVIGIALMLGFAFWGGTLIGEGIILLAVLFLPFFYNSKDMNTIIILLLISTLTLIISSLWITTFWLTGLKYIAIGLMIVTIIIAIVEYVAFKNLGESFRRLWAIVLAIVFVTSPILVTFFQDLVKTFLTGRYLTMLFPWLLKTSSPLERSVAEHQKLFSVYPASMIPSLFGVGLLAPLALLTIALYYTKGRIVEARSFLPAVLSGLFATYLILANTSSYLTTVVGYLSALGGALFLSSILYIQQLERIGKIGETLIAFIGLIGILLLILSSANGINFALSYPPPSFLSAGTALYTPLFPKSMLVLHKECKFVLAWWDYGYMIGTVANDTTVVDPGTLYPAKIRMVAKGLTGNEETLVKVLHYFKLPPQKTCIFEYEIFPLLNAKTVVLFPQVGDFAKSVWMFRIAGYPDKVIFNKYIKVKTVVVAVLPNGRTTEIVVNGVPMFERTANGILLKLPNGKVILIAKLIQLRSIPLYNIKDVMLYAMMYKALKEKGFKVVNALGQTVNANVTFKHFKLVDLVTARLYVPNTNKTLNGVMGFVAIYRYTG